MKLQLDALGIDVREQHHQSWSERPSPSTDQAMITSHSRRTVALSIWSNAGRFSRPLAPEMPAPSKISTTCQPFAPGGGLELNPLVPRGLALGRAQDTALRAQVKPSYDEERQIGM